MIKGFPRLGAIDRMLLASGGAVLRTMGTVALLATAVSYVVFTTVAR